MQEYHARPRGFWTVLVALYIAQGIPGYLLIMAVPAALRAAGMPLQQVGMLSVLMLPLVLKFLWAPFVDRWQPLDWGHRRSWILCTQLATAAGVVLLALCGPQVPIATIVAIGMLISLSVATQDIATDGYATQQLRGTELGRGNAIQAAAVAGGVLIGGSLSLVLMERLGWQPALLLMAALCLLPLLTLPWMVEPEPDPERMPAAAAPGRAKTGPSLRNFLQRPGMLSVLALAVVIRLSEGMQRSMESSYLLHNELSLGQVGVLGGAGAAIAGLAGSALAALWLRWRSREQVLLALSGIRTLVFALFLLHSLHWLGSDLPLVGLTMALSLLRYMEMVALYALFMSASSHSQPGTDFTILACAEFLTYMLSSMAGGFIAKQFGFSGLFAVTSALAVFSWLAVARLLLSYRCTSGGSVEAAA